MPSELAAEQRHLDATGAAYDAVLRALSSSRRAQAVDEFSEEALERMRLERLRAYTAASGPLYFGRIDRADGGGPLYIGRHAVADADNELLAINWRAPAAEPFYAATLADPRGVTRRRRLDIEERTVLGYVDEELAAGGDEHLTEAIIDDITAQRVGEMRQIISTITPEQYGLISEPAAGALVVQGGPGTGKTAVGLHRAAWLLYADPALAREGVLVVGPNRTFIAYIAQVLPALGEQSVEQRSIDALVSQRRWAGTETEARATLLGSGRMAGVLARLLWARVGAPAEPVALEVARAEVTAEPAELAELIEEARTLRRSYRTGRERFRERLAGRLATHVIAASRAAARSDPETVISAVRRTREYQKLADRCWPRQTPEALVAALFRQRRRLEAAAAGRLSAEEIDLLLASDPPSRTGTMTHAEFALLDEARALIDPELRTYGHVVVDEAQNLTPMELRMVVRRARRRSLTVLGDIAQRTAEARLDSWEAVLGDAGADAIRIAELLVSYRVPDDFLALAAAVAPGASVPQGVRRAPWPAIAVPADAAGRGPVAVALAERMAADAGSVGVITPAALRAEIDPAFAGHGSAAAEDADGRLSGGIDLLGLAAIKGLEFDAAIVIEPAAVLAERPDGGPGGLYTALTRSTRALAIVHADPLPAELADSPDLHAVPADGAAETWAAGRR